MSWRASASSQCQADMDALFAAALPTAKQFLAKYGEFYPYGVTMTTTGETALAAADTGSEHPLYSAVIDLLYEGFRSHVSELRAVAVVVDVRLPDGSDAIRVDVEHSEHAGISVIVPYQKGMFGKFSYGPDSAGELQRRVWMP